MVVLKKKEREKTTRKKERKKRKREREKSTNWQGGEVTYEKRESWYWR